MYDEQKINRMIDGSYKKFKSYYYYDKTMLFIKKKIACFEADVNFEDKMNNLKKNLYEENREYFERLLTELECVILPKKMQSQNESATVIYSDTDHQKEIRKINFFICVPIELYIIDTLWTLMIGKIVNDIYGKTKWSYAGKFKKSIFDKRIGTLTEGIDFDSNRCFEPYFKLYSKWRDNALDCVKRNIDKNTLILGMDLKGFYYSVEFDFNKLGEYLQADNRLSEIKFLSYIIERMYSVYTAHIREYKTDITKDKNMSIFPIGLLSPIVLRDLYLREFDVQLINKIQPLYYGRYVDDILVVVNDNEDNRERSCKEYIKKFLIDIGVFYETNEEIRAIGYSGIIVQTEKMSCFYFAKNKKDILIEAYYEQLEKNSSEVALMPDMDLLKSSFYSKAYQVNLEGGSKKIRDIKILESNNYNVTKYISDLQRTLKNTTVMTEYSKEISSYLEQILYFYKDSAAIEYMLSWRLLFELFVVCSQKDKAKKFLLNVESFVAEIDEKVVDIVDIVEEKKGEIVLIVKKSIKEYLMIALALAGGLDFSFVNDEEKEVVELAKNFRKTNLINHQMVYFPLINYTNAPILENESLVCNFSLKDIMNEENWEQKYTLSNEKIKWSPRFIHLNEIYLWYFLCYFSDKQKQKIVFSEIHQRFLEDNNLSENCTSPVVKDEIINDNISLVGMEKNIKKRVKRLGLRL